MNNMMKSMLAYGFAIAAGFVGLNAQDEQTRSFAVVVPPAQREEFKKVDQPFMFFKTFGKCPYAMHYDPAVNQLNFTFLGSYDAKTDAVVYPRKGKDFETLTPMRFTQKFLDANVQIDRKYSGHRESHAGKALEKFLKYFGIIHDHQYEGSFMLNEYKLGVPMKWVLRDLADLKGLIAYLSKKFTEEGIIATKRPLLLLEMVQDADKLDQNDKEFLNMYFELLDPYDINVKAFFSDCQKTLLDVMDLSKDAKNVLETYTEMVFGGLEKENHEFKGKEFAAKITTLVLAAFTTVMIIDIISEMVTKPLTGKVKGVFVKRKDDPQLALLREIRDRLPEPTAAAV